ncbi:MAG: peptide ABC transporter substrate-binding protein, partial [Chloroflexota bacterium]
FGQGWGADYPDPQDFLDILFHSESSANTGNYENPQVDRLLEQARTEPDVDERMRLYQEAEQMIVNDAAWLPLWWDTQGLALVQDYVHSYTFPRMSRPYLADVWVE